MIVYPDSYFCVSLIQYECEKTAYYRVGGKETENVYVNGN